MAHDHLCPSESNRFCLECAQLENIREDERYRVLEQIAAMPAGSTRGQIADAIRPITGDVMCCAVSSHGLIWDSVCRSFMYQFWLLVIGLALKLRM